jgi:hypothetical protein
VPQFQGAEEILLYINRTMDSKERKKELDKVIKFIEFQAFYTLSHGQTPRESLFSKILNFWAWPDKLGRKM